MSLATSSKQTDILLEAGTNELEIIEFTVGGQNFGVNVAKVKQVVRWEPSMLTTLNDAPPAVMGVIYHRGKPVLLVDLKKALDIQTETPGQNAERMLVLVTQFNNIFTSFFIDKVSRIHRLSWKQLEPVTQIMSGTTSYIAGTVRIEDRLILILDLEYIMSILTPETGIESSRRRMAEVPVNRGRADMNVFFAEDSAMIRRLTAEQLRGAGYAKLQTFENGWRAYEKIVAVKGQAEQEGRPIQDFLNLLLTDIEMPQMDGLTLCRNIKKELGLAVIPVIIYSSLINEQMAQKCRSVGSEAHISKPQIHEIVGLIDRYCGIAA